MDEIRRMVLIIDPEIHHNQFVGQSFRMTLMKNGFVCIGNEMRFKHKGAVVAVWSHGDFLGVLSPNSVVGRDRMKFEYIDKEDKMPQWTMRVEGKY